MAKPSMRVVEISSPGPANHLQPTERPRPTPGEKQVIIQVKAAGVNRPDIVQREGRYPPPPGASDLPGLEVSGIVCELGDEVSSLKVGDEVMALLPGGGYAEYALADEGLCLPKPGSMSFEAAAGVPETYFTVWANVFEAGKLKTGETILIHGGSGGIGSTAILLAKAKGARVFTTSNSSKKANFCKELGADLAINYLEEDFVEVIKKETEGQGIDVVLDMVGGDYVDRNLSCLGFRGRHLSIAFLRGMKAEINIMKVMAKQLTLTGSTLRARPVAEKTRLTGEIRQHVLPLLEKGQAQPRVAATFNLEKAKEAHLLMESKDFLGKIVLTID